MTKAKQRTAALGPRGPRISDAEASQPLGNTIAGEALAWPPTTATELERFWVQRDHRYVLRKRPLTEQERAAIFAARRFDVDRLGGQEQAAAWRMLSRWVLPHI